MTALERRELQLEIDRRTRELLARPEPVRFCDRCFLPIDRGTHHKCEGPGAPPQLSDEEKAERRRAYRRSWRLSPAGKASRARATARKRERRHVAA
jgi:hypothetical protein